MWETSIVVLLVFVGAFSAGALYGYRLHHCRLSAHECRKTRARLNMWAKRYKRKVEELQNDPE